VVAFADLFSQLAADDRVKGKQFEHVCKWFLLNDPEYKTRIAKVWFWDDWMGRWGKDAGIDLVAEDHDGKLWAIQAKAYEPKYQVTKADVDTFLSESSRAAFSYRLLIASTDKLGPTARRTIDAQEKPVSVVGLTDLLDAAVNWPTNVANLRPSPKPKPAKPHDYQKGAIRDVVNGFKTSKRGQLIMACGTGKTLTSLFIHEKLTAGRTLVLVPSLSLLKQTMRVWRTTAKLEFDSLPVCSDETVARDSDAVVSTISEIGVPVTTDPVEIAAFLRKHSPRVVFSTYQSSPQLAAAFALGRVPAFDLVVADEAHRVAGPASSEFATILDAAAIKAKRRLFMTATPRYFTGRVLKATPDADLEVASMDNETRFGPVFHRLSFGEAIKRELLTDYQVAVVGVDDATYREYAERGTLVTFDGERKTDARSLAGQIGLAKAMQQYDMHRMISFHSRVARARKFAAEMPDVIAWMPARQRPKGALWADYASGEMTAGERHVRLQHLSTLEDGERGLLANARCLAEGVDVPTLDGVAFIDPRRSEVDIVQAVGRAIRKADDKAIGTIMIPVFIDTNTDPKRALDDSVFKPVWDVVKALRAHDDELAEQINSLRREMGWRGGVPKLPDKIKLDVPVTVGPAFAKAFDVRLVEQTTAPWEFWFGLAQQFLRSHGHARIPVSYTVNGYKLGAWANKQRYAYSARTLHYDRQCRLQDLRGWTWYLQGDLWEAGFSRLLEYVKQHGDARVPVAYEVDGYNLGGWANSQRDRNTRGALEADRRRRLEELPGWSWDPQTDKWEASFRRLLDYVEQHGDARVPTSYTLDGHKLGKFLNAQRVFYVRGTLDPDRQRRLEGLPGWSWDPYADRWEAGFRRLLHYVEDSGHARVPSSYTIDGYRLGNWVGWQRINHAKDILEADRARRLERLPGWMWNARADKWEEGFTRLLEYVKQAKDARVASKHTTTDGYQLGAWVLNQRTLHVRGSLGADRERRLEELPGWTWHSKATQWEEGFRRLLDYAKQHRHARVPAAYSVDGYRLGAWVNVQRTQYSKGTLKADRANRLQEVPGWVWKVSTSPP
jgi:superfamily II DNA or RNA helicase